MLAEPISCVEHGSSLVGEVHNEEPVHQKPDGDAAHSRHVEYCG